MNRKMLIIAIGTLLVDQISKIIVSSYLNLGESIKVIKNFFYITLCHNFGAAWGLFDNSKIPIIIGTIIAILLIYHFIFCFKKNLRNNIAFGLLLGGLAGNLIDRIVFGYVRDFFDFFIFNYNYPVFNVADIAIVVGVILLIYAIIRGEDVNGDSSKKRKRKTRQVSSK